MSESELTNVIYIAGAGRSGSTLLELLLAQTVAGAVTVGEIRQIWGAGFRRNHLCGCGSSFADCAFWAAVIDSGVNEVDDDQRAELEATSSAHLRNRKILSNLIWPRSTVEVARLTSITEQLYLSVQSVTGAAWIVDSSKLPAYAMMLCRCPRLRVHVVHIVRDSRAVAFSWARRKTWARGKLNNRPPGQAARIWFTHNLFALLLRGSAHAYHRVRYEDLCGDPMAHLAAIADKFSVQAGEEEPGDLDPASVDLMHGLMGNPMRHDHVPNAIQIDEQWRDDLAPRDGLHVTLLTWPLVLWFRYRLRW